MKLNINELSIAGLLLVIAAVYNSSPTETTLSAISTNPARFFGKGVVVHVPATSVHETVSHAVNT